MKKIIGALIFVLFTVSIIGCYSDNGEELYKENILNNKCDTSVVSYSGNVLPIITTSCLNLGCHTANHPDGGYSFDSHANLVLTVPGNKLINALKYTTGGSRNMPPAGKLSDCDISKIEVWINRGAKND